METPRAWTEDEIREQFLDHCRSLVNYWDKESRVETQRDRISGAVFSVLSAIDGCSCALPAFSLKAQPHPDDKQYHIDNGENYYPEAENGPDIAGYLHECFYEPTESATTD